MFIVLATGATKDKPMLALEAEYLGRLPKAWSTEVRLLPASKATNPQQAKVEESTTQLKALSTLPPTAHVIALTEGGHPHTSTTFSAKLTTLMGSGARPIVMLIGGAAGLTAEVQKAAHSTLSLSPLTFPHQLVRPILAEQLYRAHTIATGHPYHRP